MVAFPPCKINLGIHVLNRRADGFHNIETCFYPVPRTNILEVVVASHFSFTGTGITIPGNPGDNLCCKAYELLRKDFDLDPVSIYLHKMVPPGSGLGGGSSDGTWTLRILNDLFRLGLSHAKLSEYAGTLGSDCPYFLHDTPMIGTGKGEVLTPVATSLKGKYIVIVRPDIHISTRDAYNGVKPRQAEQSIRTILEKRQPDEWKDTLTNHFESNVAQLFPVIGFLKEELYRSGALYASMSGSGSAVYGIFDDVVELAGNFGMHDFWSGQLTV